MGQAPVIDDPLRLTRCMRCGYELEALPLHGKCPECGSPYNQETVVLYGSSNDGGYGVVGTRAAFASSYGLLIFITMQEVRGWFQAHNPWGLIWAGFFIAQILLEVCWRWMVRRNAPDKCLLQCRFNSRGFVQCDVPEEMAGTMGLGVLVRWSWIAVLIVGLTLFLSPFTSPPQLWWKAALLLFFFILLCIRRIRRPAAAAPEDGPLSRALTYGTTTGIIQPTPIAWSEVDRYAIHPYQSRPNRHLVRITGKQWYARDLMLAELHCTTQQAKALSARIARWVRAAREEA